VLWHLRKKEEEYRGFWSVQMDAQDKDGQQLRTKEAISLPVCLPGKWLLKQCACVCIPVHLIAW